MKKKNTFLFILLVLLLSLTYYWEEIYKQSKNKSAVEKISLVTNINGIQKIEFPGFTLELLGNEWKLQDWNLKVSEEKVSLLIEFFSFMKISSKIALKERKNTDYFSEDDYKIKIITEKGPQVFQFGHISPVSGRFYVQSSLLRDLVLVVENSSPIQGAYKNELDKLRQNYLKLKNILKSNGTFLLEDNLLNLNRIKLKDFERAKLEGRHNRWFELNFFKQETFPMPFKSLKVHPLQHQFKKIFSQMVVREIDSSKQKILSEKRGSLTFFGKKNLTIEYFKQLNSKYGDFVKIKDEPHVYYVEFLNSNIFEISVQHFWRKKIDYQIKFSELKKLKFDLNLNNDQKISCYIDDLNSFEVKTEDKRVENISTPHINFLFNLIFNLTEFTEAKYVLARDEKVNLSNFDIVINLLNKSLGIRIDPHHIIVYDIVTGLEFYFNYNKEQIKEDFFSQLIEFNKDGPVESN